MLPTTTGRTGEVEDAVVAATDVEVVDVTVDGGSSLGSAGRPILLTHTTSFLSRWEPFYSIISTLLLFPPVL